MLLAYFAPISLTFIVLAIQRIVKLGRKKSEIEIEDSARDKNTIDLSDGDHSGRKTEDPL